MATAHRPSVPVVPRRPRSPSPQNPVPDGIGELTRPPPQLPCAAPPQPRRTHPRRRFVLPSLDRESGAASVTPDTVQLVVQSAFAARRFLKTQTFAEKLPLTC